jgi:hypothetical protein
MKLVRDHWAIAYYMGVRVDLTLAYDSYKGALKTLESIVTAQQVQGKVLLRMEILANTTTDIQILVVVGLQTEDYVVDHNAGDPRGAAGGELHAAVDDAAPDDDDPDV